MRKEKNKRKKDDMKRFIIVVMLLVVALGNPSTSIANKQDENIFVGTPLMVIRFNQPSVYYQLPLYKAIQKTLEIHPAASFQIVSMIPTTGNFTSDKERSKKAAGYASLITTALNDMGLPSSRYRTNYTSKSDSSGYYEVQIFVR